MTNQEKKLNQASSEQVLNGVEMEVRKKGVVYGYSVVNHEQVIDEKEAEVVRSVFAAYAEGDTEGEICRRLREEGVLNAKGKPFTENRIHAMLSNRTYVGEFNRLGVVIVDGVPAIIDKDAFEFVQAKLNGTAPKWSLLSKISALSKGRKKTKSVKEVAPVVAEPVKEVAPVVAEPVEEVAPVVAEPVEEVAVASDKTEKRRRRKKGTISQIVLNAIMIISLFMVLYPLMMMIMGAFKSGTVFRTNKWLPSFPLRIENIAVAFDAISGYVLNTIIVAVAGIAGMVFIASMASFAMSKLKFKGSGICFSMIIAITMLPGVLSLTPQLLLYKGLGLDNSIFALILPMWTGGCVWAVFLLSGFYKGLPNDYFEAASLDGATALQQFLLIGLPLSTPIIATLVIMQITSVWNDYMWPKLILRSSNYTIAAGLAFVFESSNVSQTVKYAGYFVSAIPVALLFIFFNRFYVEGITSSGVKL